MSEPVLANIHATGLLWSGVGVIIRGPSGAGKSLLALDLLQAAEAAGREAMLVGDDRLDIRRGPSGLVMAPPPALVGLIELRGLGLLVRPFAPSAPIDLVIDLVDSLERMPASESFETTLLGHSLLRCPIPRRGVIDPVHQLHLAREAIMRACARQNST